jgi:hypothetical protein
LSVVKLKIIPFDLSLVFHRFSRLQFAVNPVQLPNDEPDSGRKQSGKY